MGYLTKLLGLTFDHNNFEESFSHREYELARFEKDNNTTRPGQVRVAILVNETSGPRQQHLQLLAGTSPPEAKRRATRWTHHFLSWKTADTQERIH